MPSQATVHVVGHLGQDPTLRHTQKGDAVLGFSVATNRPGAKRDDNEPATWWNCSLWGKRAEMYATDLRKGDLVSLNGNCYQRQYERNDGTIGYSLDVRVDGFLRVKSPDGGQQGTAQPQQKPAQPEADPFSDAIPF